MLTTTVSHGRFTRKNCLAKRLTYFKRKPPLRVPEDLKVVFEVTSNRTSLIRNFESQFSEGFQNLKIFSKNPLRSLKFHISTRNIVKTPNLKAKVYGHIVGGRGRLSNAEPFQERNILFPARNCLFMNIK